MADYTSFTEVETRQVFVLKTPTNWVEVSKVLNALSHEVGDDTYDDAVTVDVGDSEIRFVVRPKVERADA